MNKDDVDVIFVKAGGPGGQHRNKTESGVRLVHRPTGITVQATERRERTRNLALAWERLDAALKRHFHRPKPRRKTKPTAASDARRLVGKARRGRTKEFRKTPRDD